MTMRQELLGAILECILVTPAHLDAILNFIAVVWEGDNGGKARTACQNYILK